MRKWMISLVAAIWLTAAAAVAAERVVLDAENMTCPTCSITIEKALEAVPGVIETKVDTDAGTVTVTFDSERADIAAVADAITNAGFPAKARSNGD